MHNSAINVGKEIAEQRGHIITRIKAKPSFGNLILWKTIYETDNQFYVDATNLLFNKVIQGRSIKKLNLKEDFPWLKKNHNNIKM